MERIVTSVMSWRMRGKELAGLDDEQRRRINQCLCDGEPADDPELAKPLVRQAERMLGRAVEIPVKPLAVLVVLMVAGSGYFLLSGLAAKYGFQWQSIVMIGAALWLVYAVPRNNRLWRHVTQSRKATKDKWGIRP
ncbi:hypothetical protein [Kibdelosporangium phytohabitans]|uniref:DUF3040 domain-containing protein n=1 Tax=Kibdelosporangium phytohabitans TaxID=860235 RepID=A0A0N9I201_9PSEU|nr:hypothetical protein [Kibdelosporangium phytohabitans]ALG09691.1 hypothetical protein AOZ06_24785 [Kibdelosporangium phytohabitans]MBE1468958.1 hypothetical protein [Kibdelosporangium phytohabitans]